MDSTENEKGLKAIEREALHLGFSGFGVARPEIPEAAKRLQEWVNQGFAGIMAYINKRMGQRSDPDKVLSGVKSIICLRTDYLTAEKDLGFLQNKMEGDVSLYALNEDYHNVIQPKLRALEDKIKDLFPGCRTKSYVDTGPVLEKALAQKAGIGWIGKHTNLITEGLGSWYFLSEILLDIELAESTAAQDHCGTCRECIDICPTQAIVAPYVLDSRKCISYLTIELKGVIPLEFRKAIGNRIYGCDDCQIVCPWNSFAQVIQEPAFQGQSDTQKLIDLMVLDQKGFHKRFRKSAVWRIKRRGLLRNVAVALGNSGDLQAVPALTKALQDKEPLIRAHAVWALGELLGETAEPILKKYLPMENNFIVLEEVDRLLKKLSF